MSAGKRRLQNRVQYSSRRLNHDALCKPILAKLACVHPKPNKTAATKEHKAASVLCGSSSAPYLTTALEKSFSPFPKASPKALQRCSKNLRDFKQLLSPPTSFHPTTRASGQQTLGRNRAGDKQKPPPCLYLHMGWFSL